MPGMSNPMIRPPKIGGPMMMRPPMGMMNKIPPLNLPNIQP